MYSSTNPYEWELPGRSLSSKYTNTFAYVRFNLTVRLVKPPFEAEMC